MAGVLKDILLVVASMVIFGDPVSGQQYVGYSIALGGLVYYKLGAEKLQALANDTKLSFNEARRNHPAKVKLIAMCAALGFVTIVVLGWRRGIPDAAANIPSQ